MRQLLLGLLHCGKATEGTHIQCLRSCQFVKTVELCLQTAMFVYPLRLLRPTLVEKLLDFGMRPLFRAVQISASATVPPWLQPPKCEPRALLTARRLEVEAQTSPNCQRWPAAHPASQAFRVASPRQAPAQLAPQVQLVSWCRTF